ncbi:hypothetical protein [Catenulispora rubra]|uniref:hypothetical protein n=1 Tax=Catenulispora rubra TaxID=280293 RepID=UPI0018927790|nr:hypothetical protein [Catenulispora rubra]
MSTALSEPIGDDPFVLRARRLRPGVLLQATARFSSPVWDLSPALLKENASALRLYFDTIPDRFQNAARRLFEALLSGPLPDGEIRPDIARIRQTFTGLKTFLVWLDARWLPERAGLGHLTGEDLEAYVRHLLTVMPDRPRRRVTLRRQVRLLWHWRSALGPDALRFDPLMVDGWLETTGAHGRENSTARIPEPVLGALLAWALRFVDDFAEDILRAEQLRRRLRAPLEQTGRLKPGEAVARIRAALDEHVADDRPLPGRQGQLNRFYFAQLLRIERSHLTRPRCQAEIDTVIEKVGLTSTTCYDMTITARLNGRPWAAGIGTDHCEPYGLARLARTVQAAAYVIIAFLSGIRDCEIKHLQRGCLHIQRDADGNAYRWKVASLAFKGEIDIAGAPAVWTVGEPVARAVAVLETLQLPDQTFLFARLHHSPAYSRGLGQALSSAATNEQLNEFVAWITDYCRQTGRLDGIPLIDKRVFNLTTSQFRRTLAWFIARRPGGVIAGALAYRHHSIQMFEGYAGTSDSGFRAEVEAEQAITRGAVYMEMIEAHDHLDLAGPSAAEAAERLKDFGDRAQYQGRMALDRSRLLRIMKNNDPAIYPGEFVTCVHNAATALCEKAKNARAEGLPEHGGCLPLACRNVALTDENTRAWQRELHRIEERLNAGRALPPLLAARLTTRHAEISQFLARHAQIAPTS